MKIALLKGNEAAVLGALAAGCDAFFGYPITPASEIPEMSAKLFPLAGKVFIQAESEVAAINMVYGASSCGRRVMTASSGPGISLKSEGISYMAGAELPAVIIDVMRAGPGLGNIGPEQADYNQIIKGGGHGSYSLITLAPNSVQEMYDLTVRAFELSDKYRNPACVLVDAVIAQMMEKIVYKKIKTKKINKPWKTDTTEKTNKNVITSIYLDFNELEEHNKKIQKKYKILRQKEQMYEEFRIKDADIILTGYGIVSRILKQAVLTLRKDGIKAGLMRPITLLPFPLKGYNFKNKKIIVVELSGGQFVRDVKLAVHPSNKVFFYGRMGGVLPQEEEIIRFIKAKI